MTIEDILKEEIIRQFRTLRDFSEEIEMPYSTLMSVLKRGVYNTSLSTIMRICQKLNISTDALVKGKIIHLDLISEKGTIDLQVNVDDFRFSIETVSHDIERLKRFAEELEERLTGN